MFMNSAANSSRTNTIPCGRACNSSASRSIVPSLTISLIGTYLPGSTAASGTAGGGTPASMASFTFFSQMSRADLAASFVVSWSRFRFSSSFMRDCSTCFAARRVTARPGVFPVPE